MNLYFNFSIVLLSNIIFNSIKNNINWSSHHQFVCYVFVCWYVGNFTSIFCFTLHNTNTLNTELPKKRKKKQQGSNLVKHKKRCDRGHNHHHHHHLHCRLMRSRRKVPDETFSFGDPKRKTHIHTQCIHTEIQRKKQPRIWNTCVWKLMIKKKKKKLTNEQDSNFESNLFSM